jgi:hypothetical protein
VKITHCILVLAVLACAVTVSASEPGTPPDHSYVVEMVVGHEEAARWASAVRETAAAHASHPDGQQWSAYRKLSGGPEETVWFVFSFDKMAEIDSWVSSRRIVIDTLGAEEGRRVLADLETDQPSTDRIISFKPELSRPWPEGRTTPPANVWVTEVQVAPGKLIEYIALWKRLLRAYETAHPEAVWMVYGSTVGGDRTKHLVFYPFDRFAEVDEWQSRSEVLTRAYGAEEAAKLAAALDAISSTTRSLWHLEPELSQLEH